MEAVPAICPYGFVHDSSGAAYLSRRPEPSDSIRSRTISTNLSLHADAQPADRRYVWLNLDIDLVNIGTSYLNHFEPIAPAIKRLKLSRENTLGNFWYKVEGQYLLPLFFNVEKMYVVCIDSIINWSNDDVYLYSWPCARENLVFIDEISPLGYIEAGYLELDGYVERLHDFKKDKNELY
jgi:hypothetical protein